jgi:hypothetical protein
VLKKIRGSMRELLIQLTHEKTFNFAYEFASNTILSKKRAKVIILVAFSRAHTYLMYEVNKTIYVELQKMRVNHSPMKIKVNHINLKKDDISLKLLFLTDHQ